MELILISESKLKIMLTADDMESNGISEELLTYGEKDVRRLFEGILEQAKIKTGFDSSTGRLIIQVYPSRDGGCEVYFTRKNDIERYSAQKDKAAVQRKKKEYCVYLFDGISDAVAVCTLLRRSGYTNESALYRDRNGESRYYLVLQEEIPTNERGKKRKSIAKSDLAAEYGVRIGGRDAMLYISERTEPLLAENAVEAIGKK
ncbi:MAG: adaptor protein MecA [Clostridia bacterium]|nr:adaptor protein MecA [Clostridia bacterium]